MMRKRLVIILGSAVLLAVTGALVYAQQQQQQRSVERRSKGWAMGEGGRGQFAARRLARMADELGLTDAQREQIKTILVNERQTVQPLMKQLSENRAAMKEATKAATFDEARVRELASQQGQTLSALIFEKERVQAQVYQILTPEQRTKADSMMDRFNGRRGHGGRKKGGNQERRQTQ